MPGAAAAHARADPRRAAQGGAAAGHQGRARRRDAAAAARRDDARAAAARARLPASAPTAARRSRRRRSPRRRARRVGGEWEEREEELFGPAETLQSTFRLLRDELLTTVAQVGGRLGELRFDTDLDVSHAVVRYLELLKLAALLERTRDGGLSVAEALPEVNARLLQAATVRAARDLRDLARSTSTCSTPSATSSCARGRSPRAASRRWSRSCPRRGDGLRAVSASDIETYRTCPLKYKFARVFRIPQRADAQPALRDPRPPGARALPRRRRGAALAARAARAARGGLAARRLRRLRGGAPAARARRRSALLRYHERFQDEDGEPVWFERAFPFRLGPHLLRGRVDRVDRLPDGGYELIDYKTGRPKTAAQLREDVQLSLYAVGARESWQLEAAQQAYYYVLDDEKVPVERSDEDRDWITETVLEVADGHPGPGLRADAVLRGVLDVRLPDRLPGGGAVGASRERHVARPRVAVKHARGDPLAAAAALAQSTPARTSAASPRARARRAPRSRR